jgi:predicted dehydrogenase
MQVGLQQRSGPHYLDAKRRFFDSGQIGKVTYVRTWWHGNSWHLRRPDFTAQPAGLDWKQWLGPAADRPFDARQFWNWRAYFDFGGGTITDLFTHWIDVAHLFLGDDVPLAATAAGGVFHYDDGRTAPDTVNVLLQYPRGWTASFEATLAPGGRGAAVELVGHRRQPAHRPRAVHLHARGRRGAGDGQGRGRHDRGARAATSSTASRRGGRPTPTW